MFIVVWFKCVIVVWILWLGGLWRERIQFGKNRLGTDHAERSSVDHAVEEKNQHGNGLNPGNQVPRLGLSSTFTLKIFALPLQA